LIQLLDDHRLRRIVERKLECYTTVEIAAALRCSRRTVDLKLEMIRKRWQRETTHGSPGPSG
jgi:hypothetical protein